MVHTRTCIVIYLHSHLIAYLEEQELRSSEDKVFHRHYNFFLSMSKNLSKREQDIFTLLRRVQHCICSRP